MIYMPYGESGLKPSLKLKEYMETVEDKRFENHNGDSFVKEFYKSDLRGQKSAWKNSGAPYVETGLCQPFLYYDGKQLDCGGVTQYDYKKKTGTFCWKTKGWRLKIQDVHSYYVYAKMYGGNKFLVLDSAHIPELSDLEDIYVAASIKTAKEYDLRIYHNDEIIFERNNIYLELRVSFRDMGTYKTRPTYVRYAIKKSKEEFYNYIFSIDYMKEYQLDNSMGCPSSFIEYGSEQKDWDRFYKKVIGSNYSISIFLHLTNSKTSQILGEFVKKADKSEIVPNVFDDDDSINLKVTYINRPEDVRFVYYCAYKEPDLLGSTVMGIPMVELEKGTLNYEFEHRYVFGDNGIDVNYYKKIVRDLFKKCKEPVKVNCLPTKIYDNCISNRDMAVYIYQYLRDNFSGKYEAPYINIGRDVKPKEDFPDEIKKYDKIFQELVEKEGYKGRWKNELTLFQMIKKDYPDAVYQYHCEWLGRQSLDIFVPSINTGFEYQGQQHYQAVDFFGGEEALQKRIALDEKKKLLCKENNIKLIEWRYDEPITKMILKKKTQCQ